MARTRSPSARRSPKSADPAAPPRSARRSPPKPTRAKPPRPARSPARLPVAPAPTLVTGAPPPNRAVTTTTFRVWADQLRALQEVATARRWAQGGGRADASLVLRELLDAIADTGHVPSEIRDALLRARPEA